MPHSHAIVKAEHRHAVSRWLLLCACLVALMVAVGGYTRLSGSGLSITEWKPVHGVIPPLNAAQWQDEFNAYRRTPQYRAINTGMTLEQFQTIYWPEYIHRLIGRALGAVFFLPLLYFTARRALSRRFFLRLSGIFTLGGAQGVIGWVMVKSGLDTGPYVNNLKLALHLGLAFALLGMLLWVALDAQATPARAFPKPTTNALRGILAVLFTQIVVGAMLAGLHGGLMYNTFPSMNGRFLPPETLAGGIAGNIALIQFAHRWLAVIVALSILFWWWRARRYATSLSMNLMAAIVIVQFGLGVATLLLQAPLVLAWAHQLTAMALFACTVIALHRISHTNETAS